MGRLSGSGLRALDVGLHGSRIQAMNYPDPLKDPKNGSSQNDAHYYLGETREILGGSIYWIL